MNTVTAATARSGSARLLEALIELRDQGVIGHPGVAGGPIDLELKYLATDVFDVVISHNDAVPQLLLPTGELG
jgi:hypothetical protein